jgi:putative membrane protein
MTQDPRRAERGPRPSVSETFPPKSGSEPVADPGSASDSAPGTGERTDGGEQPVEHEPDVRFTYANERTFLAWNRTALALIATGVAATQLLPKLHVAWGRRTLGLPLIALGALVAAESFRHWQANQRAMRRDEPLPRSWMPFVLAAGILVVGVLAVVVAAVGTT